MTYQRKFKEREWFEDVDPVLSEIRRQAGTKGHLTRRAQGVGLERLRRRRLSCVPQQLPLDFTFQVIDRWKVWERDKGVCQICFESAHKRGWHLDHIIPLSRGGSHTYDNVQVTHPSCNCSKGNKVIS